MKWIMNFNCFIVNPISFPCHVNDMLSTDHSEDRFGKLRCKGKVKVPECVVSNAKDTLIFIG